MQAKGTSAVKQGRTSTYKQRLGNLRELAQGGDEPLPAHDVGLVLGILKGFEGSGASLMKDLGGPERGKTRKGLAGLPAQTKVGQIVRENSLRDRGILVHVVQKLVGGLVLSADLAPGSLSRERAETVRKGMRNLEEE
jgi:hypothetical protein